MKARSSLACLLALAWLPGLPVNARAATVVVTNLADSGPGTLRDAIAFANTNSGADVITFGAALSGQTNILTSGQLTISDALTIDASALPAGFKISGNHNSRVFEVTAAGPVTLNSLTIQDGYDPTEGGGLYAHGGASLIMTNCTLTGNSAVDGGAIFTSAGTLTIIRSTISRNSSAAGGGIEIASGTLTVTGCELSGNSAGNGGVIYASGGTLTITGSTVSSNSASSYGGGIYLGTKATLTMNSSTVSSNSAGLAAGGLLGVGYTELNNSTFAGNSAGGDGGGAYSPVQPLVINGSTLSSNSAGGNGGGIYYKELSLTNTIVAGNSSPTSPNIYFSSPGAFSGANNLTNGDPLLAPLDKYGGLTATMRPRPGSPAIDAGTDSVTTFLATDQRGYPRRYGAHVDIGAVEAQLTVVSNLNDSGAGSLRAAIADPPELIGFATNLSGGTVTLTSGQIAIGGNLTVDAYGNGITVAGNHNSRIFEVSAGATVTLDSLTLMYGYVGSGGSGGAILVDSGGTLTLNNSTVSSNSASGVGGGIGTFGGAVGINNSTLSGNAAAFAGGVANESGTLIINASTLSGNISTNNGGAIDNDAGATLLLDNSTLAGNSAVYGGGGIENYQATATINNSTLSGNSAGGAGGINNYGTLALTNTIVAGNTAPIFPDINLDISGSFSGASNLTNGTPLLAPLGNHGGPTPTMPPLHGSPAIDAGSDSVTNFLATDQRGFPRKSGAHVDIGAVEAQVVNPANAPVLTKPVMQTNGAVLVGFASSPNADFTVLASTNVALPLAQWSPLGAAMQYQFGQFLFTDPNAANYSRRFYRVTSP